MKDINIEEILSKAKEMQGQFQKMQENFREKEIQGMAGIDDADQILVTATVDGMRMVKALHIGKGALEQDTQVLTDLIIGAINNATEKLNGEMQKEVKKIYATPGESTDSESQS
jgi:DNA-binding protein YbaB